MFITIVDRLEYPCLLIPPQSHNQTRMFLLWVHELLHPLGWHFQSQHRQRHSLMEGVSGNLGNVTITKTIVIGDCLRQLFHPSRPMMNCIDAAHRHSPTVTTVTHSPSSLTHPLTHQPQVPRQYAEEGFSRSQRGTMGHSLWADHRR